MSFIEKFVKVKRKLIIIISVVILCLVSGGVGVAKYTNAVKVKGDLV